jgi:glycosyltransferase involved in cell wall biosynthesis
MTYREKTVSVVIPAYNEEGYVGRVIDTIPEYVDRVYVIDDGSTDGTWAEIERHAAARNAIHEGRFDRLVVPIAHEVNQGVGGAIKTGYLRARGEAIDVTTVLGGDAQMDPAELPKYLDPIVDGVADYAKGNRFMRPEDWADIPRFRLLGNVVLSYLTKVASGYWGTMDSQNGYTAISLDALRRADIEGMYEYYGYCNDLLVRLNAADVVVADVPRPSEYGYADGWKSHIKYTEYIPKVSVMLLQGFVWRLRRKYLLTDFNPIAAFYLLGVALLGTSAVGFLASLVGRGRDGPGTWLLGLVMGVLVFLYAAVLDREENRNLEVRVGLDPDGAVEAPNAAVRAANGVGRERTASATNDTADLAVGSED